MLTELQVALRREFARAVRYRQPLSVLVADLPASNEVIGRVREAVRLCDSAVTAPGGRVAVILPETPLTGALVVATRLADALGPSSATGDPRPFGIASYPSPGVKDADGLLQAAENAAERARSQGGGITTSAVR